MEKNNNKRSNISIRATFTVALWQNAVHSRVTVSLMMLKLQHTKGERAPAVSHAAVPPVEKLTQLHEPVMGAEIGYPYLYVSIAFVNLCHTNSAALVLFSWHFRHTHTVLASGSGMEQQTKGSCTQTKAINSGLTAWATSTSRHAASVPGRDRDSSRHQVPERLNDQQPSALGSNTEHLHTAA